jgi:hypothetical protein
MKTLYYKALVVGLTTLLAAPVAAQEDAMKDFPGYVDFGQLNSVFGEPTVQIAVGASLLKMVGAFSATEEPEVAGLFSRLQGVRVNVFETPGLAEGALDYVKDVSSTLSKTGWESVVTVNSADEQVRIFMKIDDDMVQGITVMAVEPGEAAFINVIGNLSPQELSRVMENFDIDIAGGSAHSDHDEDPESGESGNG